MSVESAAPFKNIQCRVDERGVATVQLERPDVYNAFDEEMIAELTACVRQMANRSDVRVLVLASGGKVFCAGADINWMKRASANTPDENRADAERFAAMMSAFHQCPKPIIGRVQGGAFGGGVGLVCVCDVVVASEQATFAVAEARFGILPAVIGPYLIEAVGVREARRLALTATRIQAGEAKTTGLVHHVCRPDELDMQVEAVLADMLGNGPTALQEIKELFASVAERQIGPDVIAETVSTIARVRTTEEAREGFAAFFDKRQATWSVR
ncbi:enoyl-CoA hydratase/isomerase [Caballeronia hypogeia]|uniref:Enoyl-CoA hydratase/isomerase n=1 Tax=Caballeronia hypogeia TaxID=1777140 RepID=A0A158CJ10_9BURK|nr:enoyl-CoA hydratase-related protein [Caballeronia hypogeia]SAK82260.1 enoyl-CoA hydratase/isomerase [Caballeronia hypogeia]